MSKIKLKKYFYKGVELFLTEIAELNKINYQTLRTRIKKGLSLDDALKQPLLEKSENSIGKVYNNIKVDSIIGYDKKVYVSSLVFVYTKIVGKFLRLIYPA